MNKNLPSVSKVVETLKVLVKPLPPVIANPPGQTASTPIPVTQAQTTKQGS